MDLLVLVRLRLSAAVAATAAAGALLAGGSGEIVALAAGGVFLLAGGASALNQVQERRLDARMIRTRQRPLPAGRLRPGRALALSLLLLAGGLALLIAPPATALLGGAAVLLYNGLYTFFKPRTLFALLPGALAGALPPLIGWTAAGGSPGDPRILLPAACLFLWQIPHFWLFASRWREDLRQAGLPLPEGLGSRRAERILAAWLLALAAGVLATLASPAAVPLIVAGGLLLSLYLGILAMGLYCRPALIIPRLTTNIQLFLFGFILLLTVRTLS